MTLRIKINQYQSTNNNNQTIYYNKQSNTVIQKISNIFIEDGVLAWKIKFFQLSNDTFFNNSNNLLRKKFKYNIDMIFVKDSSGVWL